MDEFLGKIGTDIESTPAFIAQAIVASSLIWAVNISIQPVQMGIRALICEACPPHQRVQATAYASLFTGVGSAFGYATGRLELPQYFAWFGDTQFKCLCVIASLALALTMGLTLAVVTEKQLIFGEGHIGDKLACKDVFKQIYRNVVHMPKEMRLICQVQFFAWLGWFPFLFYITTSVLSPYSLIRDYRSKLLIYWPSTDI